MRSYCAEGALLLCLLSLLTAFSTGASAATYASEYELLRAAPPSAISFIGDKSVPDAYGFVGLHQRYGKWFEAGMQRGGCRMLIGAVVTDDIARAEAAWRSIELTFDQQLEDGGFKSNVKPNDKLPPTKGGRVETAFFFLQELARAILVLRDSPMEAHFHDRLVALEPKLRRAADFMQSGFDGIVWKCGHTANRLLIAAKAFGLCGVVLDDETLKASSNRLVQEALKRRDADGVFIERGGRDSSYNAVSLLMGQVLHMYLPDPALEEAMVKTMAWERTRIRDTGEVEVGGNTRTGVGLESGISGKPKDVNYSEVAQALCYYGMLHDDADAVELAKKVAAWPNK